MLRSLFFLVCLWTLFQNYLGAQDSEPASQEDIIITLLRDANENRVTGLLDESLKTYKKAEGLGVLHMDLEKYLATIYLYIGGIKRQMGEVDSSLYYFQKAARVAQKTNNDTLLVDIYLNKGHYYLSAKEDTESAMVDFEQALTISHQLKDTIKIGNCLAKISITYHYQGNYYKAIEYLEKGLWLFRNKLPPNDILFGEVYNNFGDNYFFIRQIGKSLAYYFKSARIKSEKLSPSHPSLLRTYNSIAECYMEFGKLDSALWYLQRNISLSESQPINHRIGDAVYFTGVLYHKMGDLNKAMEYLIRSLEMFKGMYGEDNYWVATVYGSIGSVYRDDGGI